jgi:hypothetical protein
MDFNIALVHDEFCDRVILLSRLSIACSPGGSIQFTPCHTLSCPVFSNSFNR